MSLDADKAGLIVGKTYRIGVLELGDEGWREVPAFTGKLREITPRGFMFSVRYGAVNTYKYLRTYEVLYRVEEIIL